MNANELADEFDTYAEPHDWGKQAQAMLRQQQAEIDVLKRCLKNALSQIDRKAQSNCNGFCGEYECKENQAGCKRKAQEK